MLTTKKTVLIRLSCPRDKSRAKYLPKVFDHLGKNVFSLFDSCLFICLTYCGCLIFLIIAAPRLLPASALSANEIRIGVIEIGIISPHLEQTALARETNFESSLLSIAHPLHLILKPGHFGKENAAIDFAGEELLMEGELLIADLLEEIEMGGRKEAASSRVRI